MRKNYIFYVIKHWTLWQYQMVIPSSIYTIIQKPMIAMVPCPKYMFISQLEKHFFCMNYMIFVSYPKTVCQLYYTVLYYIEYNTV